jgi:hypothetical protein
MHRERVAAPARREVFSVDLGMDIGKPVSVDFVRTGRRS